MEDNTSKKSNRLRSVAAAVIVLVLALSVCAFLLRDRIFAPDPSAEFADIEPFTYETGSDQRFALCGDGLAIASTTGLQLTDDSGRTLAKTIFSMEAPAVDSCDSAAVFFDVGATALYGVTAHGETTQIEPEGLIISADMAENGFLTVCTEETGYKGLVTVYNAVFEPVYRWYSGSGWLLKAAVSPDGNHMAAICAESGGTVLHIFSLSSTKEKSSLILSDRLFFDLMWLSDNRLCLLSEDELIFTGINTAQEVSVSFGDSYLVDYACSDGTVAVFLSRYLTGGTGTLSCYDSDGRLSASAETDRSLVGLSRYGDRTLALYSDCCVLYTASLEEKTLDEDVIGFRGALLRSDGKALMLSAYSGELRNIS